MHANIDSIEKEVFFLYYFSLWALIIPSLASGLKCSYRHQDAQMSRDRFFSKKVNDIRKSDKLKNPAATSYWEFSSLSTVAAEILIFVVLSVLLAFFISCDVWASCMLHIAIQSSSDRFIQPYFFNTSEKVSNFFTLTFKFSLLDIVSKLECFCLLGVKGILVSIPYNIEDDLSLLLQMYLLNETISSWNSRRKWPLWSMGSSVSFFLSSH